MATKKYIIKSVTTATEENKNFLGEVHTYYHGKSGELLGAYGCKYLKRELSKYWIDNYGYDRLCDAKRNYSYNHPENNSFWTTTVEIVEVEA